MPRNTQTRAKVDSSSHDPTLPLVIVNPKSAAGSTREKWSELVSDLRAHFGPFSVKFTRRQGHGIELAEEAAKAGRKFIIACGGDGTINEVANGILLSGKDVELGVLPSGTGGDFRRTLGMPLEPREAARALREGETRRIDAGKISLQSASGENITRYFLNVSSVGLAPLINTRVKRSKVLDWLPFRGVSGTAKFAISAFQEVLDLEPVLLRVRVDDGEERGLQTIAFCIANSRYFGGGMMIAPEAKINDGYLDVVNIGDLSTAKILVNALSLYRGTHNKLDEVKTTTARKIEIRSSDPSIEVLLDADGELPGKLPAVYEVVPAALRVRVPKNRF